MRLALAIVAMVLALSAAGAHAQRDPRGEREARALFEDGLRAAEQERWADALELFRRSRSVVPRPSVLYNEAQVLVRLSRFVEARTALRDFLTAVGGLASTDATERARIDRARALAAEIDAQIATLVLTVDPADATVEIDGDETVGSGAIRTLELDPGRHAVTVRAEGRDPRSFSVSLLSGTRSAERVTLAESSATRLIVEAGDAAARIEVDGAAVGTGRVESPIAGGRHVVRVVSPTGEARQREVEVAPGTTLTVDLAGGAAAAGIESEPWFWLVVVGATLAVGGAVAGIVAATYDPGVEAPLPGQVPPGGVIEALRF